MSYIQNNLQAGEEIKYKADIHWYIFAYPVILLLLSVFFSSAQTGFFHYVSLFLLLSGLFQLIKRILLKMGTEYVVTNKKVILKSGILSRDALELVLNKCEGIRINQSLMGRMLGFGSIVDRTDGKIDFGVPYKAVYSADVVSWEADNCPLCRESGLPLVKPGSRKIK